MRLMRSQLSLQETLWMLDGDRSGYDKATADYNDAMKNGLAMWKRAKPAAQDAVDASQ